MYTPADCSTKMSAVKVLVVALNFSTSMKFMNYCCSEQNQSLQ